jgi:hypothetical protein
VETITERSSPRSAMADARYGPARIRNGTRRREKRTGAVVPTLRIKGAVFHRGVLRE